MWKNIIKKINNIFLHIKNVINIRKIKHFHKNVNNFINIENQCDLIIHMYVKKYELILLNNKFMSGKLCRNKN